MTNNAHLRWLRRLSGVALAAIATVVVVACGSASFEDKAASTTTAPTDSGTDGFSAEATTLGTDILTQFDLTESEIDELEAGCLGQTLIEALGESDARDVVTTETPSTEQLGVSPPGSTPA
ncbi:MAG: hypothetical protein ACKO5A_00945 [Actinomycetota bacterium]